MFLILKLPWKLISDKRCNKKQHIKPVKKLGEFEFYIYI